jgi:hypothetical protein
MEMFDVVEGVRGEPGAHELLGGSRGFLAQQDGLAARGEWLA